MCGSFCHHSLGDWWAGICSYKMWYFQPYYWALYHDEHLVLFFCHLEKKENKSDWVRTWANGNHLLDSQSFYYPEQVGFSIGEHDSPKIVVLEVHYDNYELKSGNFCMLSCTGAVFFFSPAKQLDNFIAFRPPSWRGLWRENESKLNLLLGLLNFPLAESNIAFN